MCEMFVTKDNDYIVIGQSKLMRFGNGAQATDVLYTALRLERRGIHPDAALEAATKLDQQYDHVDPLRFPYLVKGWKTARFYERQYLRDWRKNVEMFDDSPEMEAQLQHLRDGVLDLED